MPDSNPGNNGELSEIALKFGIPLLLLLGMLGYGYIKSFNLSNSGQPSNSGANATSPGKIETERFQDYQEQVPPTNIPPVQPIPPNLDCVTIEEGDRIYTIWRKWGEPNPVYFVDEGNWDGDGAASTRGPLRKIDLNYGSLPDYYHGGALFCRENIYGSIIDRSNQNPAYAMVAENYPHLLASPVFMQIAVKLGLGT